MAPPASGVSGLDPGSMLQDRKVVVIFESDL
jgi:hypothetical protein